MSSHQCTGNINNPLFDCNTDNNSYYGWNVNQLQNPVSVVTYFARHFQTMNVSLTFLISTSSNTSAPTVLQHLLYLNRTFISSVWDYLPANLSEGPYQHFFTLSPGVMFDKVVIIIIPNTTFQWVAIGKIFFCGGANEGL